MKDIWHYSRANLAKQVISMFQTGLSSALIFFAPRRMGKTEFLRKDVTPVAQKEGWFVFYFSFLDAGDNPRLALTEELEEFAINNKILSKNGKFLSRISKLGGEIKPLLKAEVQLREPKALQTNLKKIISTLAKHKVLLLLDEIQVLAEAKQNQNFVAALRTSLDMHKDTIKVIFTGSSQEGLRRMFSESTAPFFHFGQNLPFPELDQQFTDHLANAFELVTQRKLDRNALWGEFENMEKVPQLARALVERLVLNPNSKIEPTAKEIMTELSENRKFLKTWGNASTLNRLLLIEIANAQEGLFSEEIRKQFAKTLGINEITVSQMQSALRSLQHENLIGRNHDRRGYFIDDPNFKNWLKQQIL